MIMMIKILQAQLLNIFKKYTTIHLKYIPKNFYHNLTRNFILYKLISSKLMLYSDRIFKCAFYSFIMALFCTIKALIIPYFKYL